MSTSPNTCFFCGHELQSKSMSAKATATDEDIVPRWLQKDLGIANESVSPLLMQNAGRRPLNIRRHTIGSFKAGRVCAGCNNGWMSQLENAAKPILIALIEGTRSFPDLDRDERFAIARWTLKTAAALNRSSIYGSPKLENSRPVPNEHLRKLADGKMPTEALVVGTIYATYQKQFDFLQDAQWRNPQNSIRLQEEHRNRSYKIALSFRQLMLIAAYYPSEDYAYGINSKACFPVWATRRVVPFDHIWDDSPSRSLAPQLEVPLRNISVVSHTWQRLVDNVAFTRLIQPHAALNVPRRF